MTISFQRLSPDQTRQHYARYHREDITCFLIVKDDLNPCSEPVGLYGLIDRGCDPLTGETQGEGFLTIFPAFQFRVLNKRFLTALFDHALNCGFAKVYTWTRLKSWQKLFQRFETLGIERLDMPPPWDGDGSKLWFVKQHRKDG